MVNALWVSRNRQAIPRGYWDQGWIEALLSGDLWHLYGAPEVEHHTLKADDLIAPAMVRDGGILIIPARHHASPRAGRELQGIVERMRWTLLVLTGDEIGEMSPYRFLQRERLRAWIMHPQPDREYADARLVGSGWPPGILETLAEIPPEHERVYPWVFQGQDTHTRRHEMVEMLEGREDRPDGWLHTTQRFTAGLPQQDYWRLLARSKVALCPSGPCSADSMRTYEALEAGCVPVADDRRPENPQIDYWETVLPGAPFPTVKAGWADESSTVDELVKDWPASGNRVFSWWQREKRATTRRFWLDYAFLAGEPLDEAPVTAILATSPGPKQPEISDLDETIRSIRERLGWCEIILVFDGVRPEQERLRAAYEEYTRRALWAANTRWHNVYPLVLEEFHHQARALRKALDHVTSRYVLVMEHDTPLVNDLDVDGIVRTLDEGHLDMLRLHHETEIGHYHEHMRLDREPQRWPVPVVRTYQWSNRPHFSPVAWYKWILDTHFADDARCFVEDVMHGIVSSAWLQFGLAGWQRFRIGIYHPEGNIQRSEHLDSRRRIRGERSTEEPKYAQTFSYPSEPPAGAPQAGRRG